MDRITCLEEVAREYRAYIAMEHPSDDLEPIRSAMQGLRDGTVLRIIVNGGNEHEKDTD